MHVSADQQQPASQSDLPFLLVQLSGASKSTRHSPTETHATIGRDRANSICVPESAVSKRHAEIEASGKSVTLRDLNSKNGTSVNDEQIDEKEIVGGDVIGLGNVLLLVLERDAKDIFSGPTAGSGVSAFDAHCVLVGLSGPTDGHVYPLSRPPITIGEDRGNTIRIQEPGVSQFHAQIANTPDGPRILDLESKAGTLVDGKAVRKHVLLDGDVITVGSSRFRFELITTRISLPEKEQHAPAKPVPVSDRTRDAEKRPVEHAAPHPGGARFVLLCVEGEDKGRRWPVGDQKASIGRRRGVDIRLADRGLSRVQAELKPDPDGPMLVDLDSRNGTFVNDVRIASARIHPGDQLRMGRSVLVVEEPRS